MLDLWSKKMVLSAGDKKEKPLVGVMAFPCYFSDSYSQAQSSEILLSEDGENWEVVTANHSFQSNSAATNGDVIVIVGRNGLYTSKDGRSYTKVYNSSDSYATAGDVCYANNFFLAKEVVSGLLRSSDGVNWSTAYSGEVMQIVSNGKIFVGYSRLSGNYGVLTSSDGVTWTRRLQEYGTNEYYGNLSVPFGGDGKIIFRGKTNVYESQDGISWKTIPSAYSCFFKNNYYREYTDSSYLQHFQRSKDLSTWTDVLEAKSGNSYLPIVYKGKLLVFVSSYKRYDSTTLTTYSDVTLKVLKNETEWEEKEIVTDFPTLQWAAII